MCVCMYAHIRACMCAHSGLVWGRTFVETREHYHSSGTVQSFFVFFFFSLELLNLHVDLAAW